ARAAPAVPGRAARHDAAGPAAEGIAPGAAQGVPADARQAAGGRRVLSSGSARHAEHARRYGDEPAFGAAAEAGAAAAAQAGRGAEARRAAGHGGEAAGPARAAAIEAAAMSESKDPRRAIPSVEAIVTHAQSTIATAPSREFLTALTREVVDEM